MKKQNANSYLNYKDKFHATKLSIAVFLFQSTWRLLCNAESEWETAHIPIHLL